MTPWQGQPTLEQGSTCRDCGYDLRGLPWGGTCPECGASTRVTYAPDAPLSQMPEPLVRRLATCCAATSLVIPAVLAKAALGGNFELGTNQRLVIDVVIAMVWIGGSMLLTRPVLDREAVRYGFGPKGVLRLVARWASLGAVLIAATNQWPTGGTGAAIVQAAWFSGWALAVAGGFCLLLLLSELADWVRDQTARRYLEAAAWGPPALFLLAMGVSVTPLPGIVVIGIQIVAAVLLLGAPLGMLMLTSSVMQAIHHAREWQEYVERRDRGRE
ncbi:MAG: hypothetical protein QGH76_06200 [Phycisphaerales bacterium]|nr:hypothetical protein [Phycisphaerales bacterium]